MYNISYCTYLASIDPFITLVFHVPYHAYLAKSLNHICIPSTKNMPDYTYLAKTSKSSP